MTFKRLNNITGWVVCIIACTVYIMTMEATGSFWDCGEFIAAAAKLQVSHPPGAPLWMIVGHVGAWLVPVAGLRILSATGRTSER